MIRTTVEFPVASAIDSVVTPAIMEYKTPPRTTEATDSNIWGFTARSTQVAFGNIAALSTTTQPSSSKCALLIASGSATAI